MRHEDWAEREAKIKGVTITPKTIEQFEKENDMAHINTPPPRLASRTPGTPATQGAITELMAQLDEISTRLQGNSPKLGIYGDLSWDLTSLESDEWIMGGDDIYRDIPQIISNYYTFALLERQITDIQLEKSEFKREANQPNRWEGTKTENGG